MSLKWIMPKEERDQLICSSCGNYLSIFPIYLKSDNSGARVGAICGRCTPMNKENWVRDEAFEAIADFFIFPCQHKRNGCEEELTPRKLKKHEPTCPSRKFECPTKQYTRCEWLGPKADLVGHFEDNHPDLLLKTSQFIWDFRSSYRENLLLPFEGELFVVNKEVDARKENFSCSVQRVGAHPNSIHYNYTVKLLSDNTDQWHRLPVRNTENDKAVTVNVDTVREKLNHPLNVLVRIEIIRANEGEGSCGSLKKSSDANPHLNWDVLNELECPVCYDIMFPPIYQCLDGHSICTECKSALRNCPLCRKDILETRNFSLEKLTQCLTYPCKFYKHGCNYASKSAEIKNHEEICEHGPYRCPMAATGECQEQINKSQIVAHMEEKHGQAVHKTNRVKVNFRVNEVKKRYYFIKFSGTIFTVQYKYEYGKFYWSVQMAGSADECRKFKFGVDVVDNSKNNLKYYVKGFCVPIREAINFEDPRKFVMLTYEQLQPLITTALEYYIHILVDKIERLH